MKKLLIIMILSLSIVACKNNKEEKKVEQKETLSMDYKSFGDQITSKDYLSSSEELNK
jgi:uncharacterized protein YcfL